ncbi:Glycosyl hydrolases family 18 [Sinomicrobium oceani]|uniref:Glycosyl hydrolases family 18 n=1 Tax=Sinomicrobium oceani TaxID=1150368 RepID=A0A1K1M994_9FLAO|nr:glycosyl hydrolase family 18 protein [Sinomicrobium oceani]SFW19667.1 Glycosyl hydrolases family 18 [Sinomicrobium oceani]
MKTIRLWLLGLSVLMCSVTGCSEYGFPGGGTDAETEGNSDTLVIEGEPRSPLSVVYIETKNSLLTNADCIRMEDGKPAFDIAVIFAGNINMDANGEAEVRLNPGVTELLENNITHVKQLQEAGTKVLLSILGNHDEAGWSCFESYADAEANAVRVRDVVEKYGLDGIEIDDEYSKCPAQSNSRSLIWACHAIRQAMPGKIIAKALGVYGGGAHEDLSYTYEGEKLSDLLDYGWTMSYWGVSESEINSYLNNGFSTSQLGEGIAVNLDASYSTSKENAVAAAEYVRSNGLGILMFFELKYNSDRDNYLTDVFEALYGQNIEISPDCLENSGYEN